MDAFEEAEEKKGWLNIQNILKVHQNLLGSLVHDRKKELVEFLFCAFFFCFYPLIVLIISVSSFLCINSKSFDASLNLNLYRELNLL